MSKVFVFMKDIDTSQQAQNKREVWFPRTGSGYYDPSARRYFETKTEKRAWLATHGMREAGELVNPNKPLAGRAKVTVDAAQQRRIQEYIKSQGGTEGLLRRLNKER